MTCTSKFTIDLNKYGKAVWNPKLMKMERTIKVPCGRCLACKINRANMWRERIIEELTTRKTGCFVTITYNDDNIPKTEDGLPTLRKKDLQDWIKRLRWYYVNKIKYFAAGEYGPKTFRPHYHAIFLGIGVQEMKSFGRRTWGKSSTKEFKVKIACPETIGYVLKYSLKSMMHPYKKILPNAEKPFALMSKGIGVEWMEKNKETITDNLFLTTFNGNKCAVPKLYKKLLKIQHTDFPLISDEIEEKILKNEVESKQRALNLEAKEKLKEYNL